MEFGLLSEGFLRPGVTEAERYHQVIREFLAAEEAGFDVVGMSEQHFISPMCTFGAAEPVYGAIAALTSRIKIRTSIILLPYHHPLNVAERIATLDILSKGRVEFGTGRGNSWLTAGGFDIPLEETEGRWRESLEVILKAWEPGEMEHHGQFFDVPPRDVVPKPVQKPHPPLWYAAISPHSHEMAGRLGMGVMSLTIGVTKDQVERRIARYHQGQAEGQPLVKQPVNKVSVYTLAYCAEDRVAARREAEEPMLQYLTHTANLYEEGLRRQGTPVAFGDLRAKLSDFNRVAGDGMVMCGDPDDCIKWIREYEAIGVGEIMLRIEGVPHEKVMESIRTFGKHVIPSFKKVAVG